ncbi:transporter substrate-binding domain-containing protein [Simiduia agarivorans]|uniref:transporter substrate-binding domain-containing protein n=1 Tax=Simiduia agarivorans TaxID=447471 RepID=UPI0002E3E8E7|nr:transporter substrate-binding domain-containing protein [Simiduia agarivorans]
MWCRGLGLVWLFCVGAAHAQLQLDCAEVFRPANDRLLAALAGGGVSAQCHYLPSARGSQQVMAAELDGALLRTEDYGAAFPTLIRLEPAAHRVLLMLYRRRGSDIDLGNWREQSIVSLRGAVVLDRMLAGLNVSRVGSLESGLKQLSAGRADVLVGDQLSVPALMRDWGIDNVEMIYPPLATQLLYLYLRPEHASLAAPISAILMQPSP